MEKSKEFILNRIKSGYCDGLTEEELANSHEIQFTEVVNMMSEESGSYFYNDRFTFILKDTVLEKQCKFDVIYNPDAEFEYFTMETCVSDGTLYFGYDLMTKILEKILRLQTVNKEKQPEDINEKLFDYDICYTVGNFVFNNEHGEFGTEDKPWLHSKFTMMLPIKCEFIRK